MNASKCIKPDDIQEGDWVAYLHREAPESVVKHIRHCAFCAEQVEQLRMMDARLLDAFYRDACPSPEVLADYGLGRLPDAERLRVAAHVRGCPVCSEELASVGSWRESEPVSLLARLQEALALAWLAHQVAQAAAPVRGAGWQSRFEQGDVVITLSTRGAALTGRVRSRAAALMQPRARTSARDSDAIRGGQVWLLGREARVDFAPVESKLDERGRFRFNTLAPGEYDLLLRLERQDIAVEAIRIA